MDRKLRRSRIGILAVFLFIATYKLRAADDDLQTDVKPVRLKCEGLVENGRPAGAPGCPHSKAAPGNHCARQPGWFRGVFMPSLSGWYHGVCDYVAWHLGDGTLTQPRTLSTACATCSKNSAQNRIHSAEHTTLKPLSSLPYPVGDGVAHQNITAPTTVGDVHLASDTSESIKITPAKDPEPDMLQVVATQATVPADARDSLKPEDLQSWKPVASNSAPSPLPQGLGADTVPEIKLPELECRSEQPQPQMAKRDAPQVNEPGSERPSERNAALASDSGRSSGHWLARLQQWRTWLAITGVALILVGWVGRSARAK